MAVTEGKDTVLPCNPGSDERSVGAGVHFGTSNHSQRCRVTTPLQFAGTKTARGTTSVTVHLCCPTVKMLTELGSPLRNEDLTGINAYNKHRQELRH